MCGQSEAKIGELQVRLELGYFGGKLRVGDEAYTMDRYDGANDNSDKVREALAVFTKAQIVDMLMCLVNNGEEIG